MYILGYIKSNFPPYPPWPVEDDAALFEITGCSNEEINGYYTYKKIIILDMNVLLYLK